MRVIVASVGTPKSSSLATAIQEYESRISRYFKFEAIEVRQQRTRTAADVDRAISKESADLLARIPKGLEVVALDERGTAWSSEQLAAYLDSLGVHGKSGVAFLIGGPFGLSETLREASNRLLSLSAFTLPHELARLVLAEQIYRAGTIVRGEPYHKGE
jgi:23S rRNA (pseudouridine1915-N3)-methyltransferase